MKRLEVISPEYVFLKLKPNQSIRNNSTHRLARTIASLYRNFWNTRVREEEKILHFFKKEIIIPTKMSFKKGSKVGYYIYMEKEKIEFYLIVPQEFYKILKESVSNVWHGITAEEVEEIPGFSENAYMYQMVYEKEDGLSLVTNRTDNDLLSASLNTVELLEDGDKAGIFYNFIPTSQGSFKYAHQATLEKVKNGIPTDRNKMGIRYGLIRLVQLVDYLSKIVSEAFVGEVAKQQNDSLLETMVGRLNGDKQVKESTKNKVKGQILKTQIVLFSESPKTKITERSYVTSIAQSFDVLSGDNRLIGKKYDKKIDFTATYLPGVEINKMWDEEIQSFVSLPGKELLERFPFIDKVETQEIPLPKDLQTGTKCIGEVTYRGGQQKAYLTEDEQFKKLMLLLVGPNRSGKSNLITHLCIDAILNGECVIIFDFIKKCELSTEVAKHFPKEKILEIEFDDFEKLQGIGYNEVLSAKTQNPFQIYDNAKRQTTNTLVLINAVNNNGEGTRLTPKMERFLESACLVVYISGGSVKDVISVLGNHVARQAFINKIPKVQKENLEDYVDSLRELDEISSKTGKVVGTKSQPGITDRISTLKRNTYMELMLKKGLEKNINLVEEMQKNQLIVIKMPQVMFTTDEEKDVFTTYWITKIWLALQIRSDITEDEKDLKLVNLVVDELYQVNNTEKFFKRKLSQIAKFGLKPIISAHYINQLSYIKEEMANANPSYMLLAGCNEKNFNELKNELYPFTPESLQNLPRFHSMNYIKTKEGYSTFITKLPGDVKKRKAPFI